MTSEPPNATRRPIGRRALLVGGLAALPVAAFGGYQAWSVTDGLGRLRRTIDLPGSGANPQPGGPQTTADPEKGRPVDILLLGSDSRDNTSADGRSDTIMLLHLSTDRKHAYLISFPRDLWVDIPGHGKNKINAAFSFGGTKLLASTVNELTGTGIDHAAVIDFAGFADLTESVGGVTIDNSYAFNSHGYHYPKGKITMSGKRALWFVRERHALPNGDFDRAANQRKVVKALVAKLATPGTLADPSRLSRVIANLGKYVTVDSGLSDRAILGLASSMKTAASSLVTLQAPVSGIATIDGQSVDVIDTALMGRLAKALQDDTVGQYVAGSRSH